MIILPKDDVIEFEGVVTEDIADGGTVYKMSEVGDWITDYIKNR